MPASDGIVRALGSFADVADDPWLSNSLGRPNLPNETAEYWQKRQPQIAQAMFGQTETGWEETIPRLAEAQIAQAMFGQTETP